MQLCKIRNEVYRVYFVGLEYHNIKKALVEDISIRNVDLCYYIENVLPERFEECNGKRIFVNNISTGKDYLCANISLQDIRNEFGKPKFKYHFFKITDVTFENENEFNNWAKNKKYTYRVKTSNSIRINVLIFNMTLEDEMRLSFYGGRINKVCNAAEYVLVETLERFKKQIKAFT